MNYTTDDIVFIPKAGKKDMIVENHPDVGGTVWARKSYHEYRTKDGLYYTVTDADGYSYWHSRELGCRISDQSYGYLFILDTPDYVYAVEKLNTAINR